MSSNQFFLLFAEWGMDGYFWIERGVDECAIESLAVAVTPIP